jgi:NCAIR mutase (PurE)-related protein
MLSALRALADGNGRAIASRVTPEQFLALETFSDAAYDLQRYPEAQMVVLVRDATPSPPGGHIAVFAAGTSDVPVASEAAIIAREMGCDVLEIHDIGVAGLHRLIGPLRRTVALDVDAIVVAAGMDGALPTVIAGLVDVPVIGLPVSVGYGAGANGQAALLNMLQSCAPGLAVVNIDNGIGAGVMAALISRRNRQSCTGMP